MDQPAHPDPHHTGDCSLINPEECPIVVDRFRSVRAEMSVRKYRSRSSELITALVHSSGLRTDPLLAAVQNYTQVAIENVAPAF